MSVLKSKVLCTKDIREPYMILPASFFWWGARREAFWQALKFESSSLRMIVQISAQVNFITFFSNLPEVLVLNSPPGSHHFID